VKLFNRIEKKVIDVINGSKSVMLEIQSTDKYQNTALVAETNEKLKFSEILNGKYRGDIKGKHSQ
jgi:hypothetical protein